MKKLVFTMLTLLTGGMVYALPVGNPADASLLCDGIFWEGNCCRDPCDLAWCDSWSIRLGFYGDYVFNRHMQVDTIEDQSDIETTKLNTNAAFVAFNLYNRFDLFGTFGATNVYIQTPQRSFGTNTDIMAEVSTETDFSWSIGARATAWECGCFTLGFEAQYFSTRPDIDFYKAETNVPFYFSDNVIMKYREWQVGGGIAYSIDIVPCSTAFVPYISVKWSRSQIKMDKAAGPAGQTLFNLESEKDWGYAVGFSIVGCNKWSFTLEGRFSDEKAAYLNSQLRF